MEELIPWFHVNCYWRTEDELMKPFTDNKCDGIIFFYFFNIKINKIKQVLKLMDIRYINSF